MSDYSSAGPSLNITKNLSRFANMSDDSSLESESEVDHGRCYPESSEAEEVEGALFNQIEQSRNRFCSPVTDEQLEDDDDEELIENINLNLIESLNDETRRTQNCSIRIDNTQPGPSRQTSRRQSNGGGSSRVEQQRDQTRYSAQGEGSMCSNPSIIQKAFQDNFQNVTFPNNDFTNGALRRNQNNQSCNVNTRRISNACTNLQVSLNPKLLPNKTFIAPVPPAPQCQRQTTPAQRTTPRTIDTCFTTPPRNQCGMSGNIGQDFPRFNLSNFAQDECYADISPSSSECNTSCSNNESSKQIYCPKSSLRKNTCQNNNINIKPIKYQAQKLKDIPKDKNKFELTPTQKILVEDQYYPGLIEDSINQIIDFNKVAAKYTPKDADQMSLIEGFDCAVKLAQSARKQSIGPISNKYAVSPFTTEDGPIHGPFIDDVVLEDSVRATAITLDVQTGLSKRPENDSMRAINCLMRAIELNEFHKGYRGAEMAANQAPPDKLEAAAVYGAKSFQIDKLSTEKQTVQNKYFNPLELVSYIGVTRPIN